MSDLLSISDLSITFDNGPRVVDGLSLSIDKGQTLALVGESHWAVPLAVLIFAGVIAGLYARLRGWASRPLS